MVAIAVPERTATCLMRLLQLGVAGEADDGVLAVSNRSVALKAANRRLRLRGGFLSGLRLLCHVSPFVSLRLEKLPSLIRSELKPPGHKI